MIENIFSPAVMVTIALCIAFLFAVFPGNKKVLLWARIVGFIFILSVIIIILLRAA